MLPTSVLKAFTALCLLAPTVTALPNGHPNHSQKPYFYAGHDLSSLKIEEDGGFIYKDTARGNATRPVEDILGDGGMNTVRLRLWVNPVVPFDDGYYETYNLDYVTTVAQRFSKKGYKIYLDYHFSDYWADPNKQARPVAWPTTVPALAATLRQYVSSTLLHLHANGVDPALVSLGNEIRHGLLWPQGYVDVDTQPRAALNKNFTDLATLWAASRQGVRDAVKQGAKKPTIMIHIDDGYNVTLQQRWFSALTSSGQVKTSDWDVFGFSFYPFYGTAATFANLKTTLNTISKQYGKPVHVAETDWPAMCTNETGTAPELSEPSVPASVPGQLEWVHTIIDIVKAVPHGLGQGVHYWEPAWLNNTGLGSACQDAILFRPDFSQWPKVTGYSRESVNIFKNI